MEKNIIVAGIGGQGSILVSHLIAESMIVAHGDRYAVRVGETFGAAQRGGAVASHIRIGEEVRSPLIGRGRADLIIALEPLEGLRTGVEYLSEKGIALLNTEMQIPVDVKVGSVSCPEMEDIVAALQSIGKQVVPMDGTSIASDAGTIKVLSVVMLGAAFASGVLPVDQKTLLDVIATKVPPKTVEMNMEAFHQGLKMYQAMVN